MNRYKVKLVYEYQQQRLTYERTLCAETFQDASDHARSDVIDWYMGPGEWPLFTIEVEQLS